MIIATHSISSTGVDIVNVASALKAAANVRQGDGEKFPANILLIHSSYSKHLKLYLAHLCSHLS